MDYGDYYWRLYRDYCTDPFPHSELSTRERKLSAHPPKRPESLVDLRGVVVATRQESSSRTENTLAKVIATQNNSVLTIADPTLPPVRRRIAPGLCTLHWGSERPRGEGAKRGG